jgi:hypothetical protein
MFYACPVWEFAADTHSMKVQRLQNRVPRVRNIEQGEAQQRKYNRLNLAEVRRTTDQVNKLPL